MSEYCFEYTCYAKGATYKNKEKDGKKEKDGQDLTFLLFQDYEMPLAPMCAQVILQKKDKPSIIPATCAGIRLCHLDNSIDAPKEFDTGLYQKSTWISKDEIKKYGGFLITGNTVLSGTGIFGFAESKTECPKPVDCFVYSINFCEKQEIVYRIFEHKNTLVIEVLHPLLRSDIQLELRSQKGSKPLDKELPGKTVDNEPIILKAGMKSYERFVRKSDQVATHDFRLYFKNPQDETHYLLVDESEETLEERKAHRGKAFKREKRYFDDHKRDFKEKKCPFCFEPLNLPNDIGKSKEKTICDCSSGKNHVVPYGSALWKKMKSANHITCCGRDYRPNDPSKTIPTKLPEPYKHIILPDDYLKKPSMNITFVGETSSGKSVLLSTMLGARVTTQQQTAEEGGTTDATNYLLKTVVPQFSAPKRGGASIFPLNKIEFKHEKPEEFPKIDSGTLPDADKDEISIKKEISKAITDCYTVTVGKNLPEQTKESDLYKRGMQPFAFELGELGYAFFYDVPGEVMTKADKNLDELRAVTNTDCLIMVINGFDLDKIGDSVTNLKKILLENIKRDGSIGERVYKIPVAIVLAKFDLLQDAFDENCHVRRENMLQLLKEGAKRRRYEGSPIERHINCSSYEIEHYLAANGQEKFVLELESKFKYYKFFAVSALGSDDCVEEKEKIAAVDGSQRAEKYKKLIYRERPLRLELPLVWLMYQEGLIRR